VRVASWTEAPREQGGNWITIDLFPVQNNDGAEPNHSNSSAISKLHFYTYHRKSQKTKNEKKKKKKKNEI
jgi:hypothetical protein